MFVFQLGPIVLAAALLAAGFPSLEPVSKPKVASGFSRTSRVLKPLLQYPSAPVPSEAPDSRLPAVVINDNRQPAGTLANGVLTLDLRASVGLWRPEGDAGPALRRRGVRRGFVAALRSRAAHPGAGGHRDRRERPQRARRVRCASTVCASAAAQACAPVDVPAGETRQVRFKTGPAGTYHYWATTTGMPLDVPRRRTTRSSRVRSSSIRRATHSGCRPHLRHHRLDEPDARRS